VLALAKGKCGACGATAPFLRPDGTPYLEPHHLRRVSDGGPDHPAHVIALCPNCHRRVHAGADGGTYNAKLNENMATIEP
jgi:5-methylcytosine-specific restriction enzyme A